MTAHVCSAALFMFSIENDKYIWPFREHEAAKNT